MGDEASLALRCRHWCRLRRLVGDGHLSRVPHRTPRPGGDDGTLLGRGQGMVASYHNDRRGQEAAERERLASLPPPPPLAYAPRPTPTGHYRTAEATRWLAIVGALVAAANAAAQLSPEGGFTVEGLTVTAPNIDHAGWAIVGAMMVGVLIAAIATVLAGRRLTRAPLPPTPGDAPERHPTVLVVGFGAAGMFVAALQWLGLVPAIGPWPWSCWGARPSSPASLSRSPCHASNSGRAKLCLARLRCRRRWGLRHDCSGYDSVAIQSRYTAGRLIEADRREAAS